MKICEGAFELIGHTPLLTLNGVMRKYALEARLIAKLELFNPAGSIKDRVAYSMIRNAENAGLLKNNSVIIEPTSGNTGIGLASVATAMGYLVIIVMPDTMSVERRQLIGAYGARLVLSDGTLGMKGAIDKAKELALKIPGSYIPGQFTNPANPKAHYETTGPEIWADTDGTVDIFVAGVGTGGTITGVSQYLKERNSNIRIVAVEPVASPVLSAGTSGSHKIQGIGAGFVPQVLNPESYDEVITVSDADAFAMGRMICHTEGILVGISSGAALRAAIESARRKENQNNNIVVLFPDTGDRYLSSPMFTEENSYDNLCRQCCHH